ncbi:UNVERIFIED_CONTAM: hypothetical protein FKN15_062835 [Acipenser sinensis]
MGSDYGVSAQEPERRGSPARGCATIRGAGVGPRGLLTAPPWPYPAYPHGPIQPIVMDSGLKIRADVAKVLIPDGLGGVLNT